MAGLLDLLSSGLLGQTYDPTTNFVPAPGAMPVYPMAGQPQATVDMSARSKAPAQSAPLPQQLTQEMPQTDVRGVPTGGSALRTLANGFNSGTLFGALSGISDAASGRYSDPQSVQQATMMANYQALRGMGVPDAVARLGAINPNVLQLVADQQITQPKLQETGADPITGQKSFAVFNPTTQSFKAVNPQGAPGSSAVGGIDATLPPTELMAQADKRYPGVANRVEQLYRGEGGMPNVRQNPLDRAALQYIQIVHPDWNMTMWTAKNKMQQQLSSGAPSSLGGRLSALRNAFDHLANVSDSAVSKGNFDLGLSPLSWLANEGKSLTTSQRDIGSKMEREAVTYGGERTKFLTGSEGSEAERRAFLDKLGPNSAAPAQMAGTIEGEYTQLKSALLNQEQQIREQLGDEYLKRHPIITPEIKQKLDTIEGNIKKLRGGNSTAAPASGLPSGWSVQVH